MVAWPACVAAIVAVIVLFAAATFAGAEKRGRGCTGDDDDAGLDHHLYRSVPRTPVDPLLAVRESCAALAAVSVEASINGAAVSELAAEVNGTPCPPAVCFVVCVVLVQHPNMSLSLHHMHEGLGRFSSSSTTPAYITPTALLRRLTQPQSVNRRTTAMPAPTSPTVDADCC